MFKKCKKCEREMIVSINKKTKLPNYKNMNINGVVYDEAICKNCVDCACKDITKHSLLKAKVRFDIPDDVWKDRLKNRYTTEWWIAKYGEDGLRRQTEWKEKTAGSLKRYISKYGKKEGTKKYNDFKANCSIFNEGRIEKYGEEHYNKTIENYKNRHHNTRIGYYLNITDGNYEEASNLLAERQATGTLEKCIAKYGEIEGRKKYDEILKNKLMKFAGVSKFENEMISSIVEKLNKEECHFGDNQYMFFTDLEERKTSNKKVYKPDLYIPKIKLVIEMFGDFWHMNPLIYNENSYNNVMKKTAKQIWQEDENRIKFIKNKYDVDTIVVWENDLRNNKNKIIEEIVENINGKSKTA